MGAGNTTHIRTATELQRCPLGHAIAAYCLKWNKGPKPGPYL